MAWEPDDTSCNLLLFLYFGVMEISYVVGRNERVAPLYKITILCVQSAAKQCPYKNRATVQRGYFWGYDLVK